MPTAFEMLASERVPTAEELRREFPSLERPMISLGTIFVSDENVSICGSVDIDVAAGAELQINGRRVPITTSGNFCAVVRLEGYWGVEIVLETATQERFTLELPMKAL